jgi:hypothetical protein
MRVRIPLGTPSAVMHLVRHLDCLSSETGSIPVQRANSTGCREARSSRLPRKEEIAGSNPATLTI